MLLSKTQLNTLLRLINGETIAASVLRHDIADRLISEGLLTVGTHGSRRSFKAIDQTALKSFLATQYEEFHDIGLFSSHESKVYLSRSKQATKTGNSKIVKTRSCPGFPVNSYEPIQCTLEGHEFTINPPDGSFVFISDWQTFIIPSDVVIVGIENMENFQKIRQQQSLFDEYFNASCNDSNKKLLFVSRYPQSTDLRTWLQSVPNRYVHFGDFDLAGINIFLTEFYKYLGNRSSLLIPSDIESHIIHGTTKRYNNQYTKFQHLTAPNPQIQSLINLINKYHRCYDQEGYISQ